MQIEEAQFGSGRYEETLALRTRVLRDPLGVAWTETERCAEPVDRHFALCEERRLVACVVARDLGAGRCKFRQMAVEPDRQGEGLGRRLLESVEALLRAEGARHFELNARETAQGFYERLGYAAVGERFLEVGIPHRRMEKAAGGGR